MSLRARFRRLVEDLLPWFDAAEERERRAYSARLEERANAARGKAESTRKAYEAMGSRMDPRKRR